MNMHRQRPIGFWLKRTDELLTQRVGETLAEDGLTRVHWQVLNLSGATSYHDLFDTMKTFVDRAGTAAQTTLLRKVAAVRERARKGITDDEYLRVVTTLQRMVENLENAVLTPTE